MKEVKNKHIQKSINNAFLASALLPCARRPGAVIQKLPEEDRQNLRKLTAKDIAQIPEWMEPGWQEKFKCEEQRRRQRSFNGRAPHS